MYQSKASIGPSLRSFGQAWMPFHDQHISSWRLDLGAKIVMGIDDLLSDLAVARSQQLDRHPLPIEPRRWFAAMRLSWHGCWQRQGY